MFSPGQPVKFSATKQHYYEYDCGLLTLGHWSRYDEHGNRMMFTILDEDDHLEWVCSASEGPLEIKIPRASIYHRISVTAMILKEDDSIHAGSVDDDITRDYRIIAKRSVAAIDLSPVDCPEIMKRSVAAIDWPPEDCPEEELSSRLSSLRLTSADDVISPKTVGIGGGHLNLHLQPGEDSDAIATVCIAYDVPASVPASVSASVDRWLISITKTKDPSVGRIFSVPASGPSLQFPIPFDAIETAAIGTDAVATDVITTEAVATATVAIGVKATDSAEYDVEVSGLQLLDKESCYISRVLCKAVTKVTRPAKGLEVSNIQDLEIKVIRRSFYEVVISVPSVIPATDKWILKVEKLGTLRAAILCPRQIKEVEEPAVLDDLKFEVPLHFEAGSTYGLMVEGIVQAATIYRGVAEFRAECTVAEIRTLYTKALAFAGVDDYAMCLWFYRNKCTEYFEDILKHGGLMRTYDKDNSGDPANPINLRVKGLFFSASVDRGSTTGQPIRVSPFGSARLLVPAQHLLDLAPNMYFADFFCMFSSYHYVTLVLTR